MDYVRVVSNAIRSPRYSARTISIGRLSVSSERRLSRNIGIAEVDSSSAASRGDGSAVSMRSTAEPNCAPASRTAA
jgi:hypothetical protein